MPTLNACISSDEFLHRRLSWTNGAQIGELDLIWTTAEIWSELPESEGGSGRHAITSPWGMVVAMKAETTAATPLPGL
jgi:hypothetical protein